MDVKEGPCMCPGGAAVPVLPVEQSVAFAVPKEAFSKFSEIFIV